MRDLVSVIVPIYNVEEYLSRCIDSIVKQTYTNLEIILVDDGSPDNCPKICDEFADKDARIKVIHKKNGGLSDARNAGLEICTGEYISFIDSDDWVHQDFIKILYDVVCENDADIAECAVSYVDESNHILRKRGISKEYLICDNIEAIRLLICEDGVYQTVWNKLYSRKSIGELKFPFGKLNEDEFWTYKVFDKTKKIAVVNTPLYNYFQRDSSIMGNVYSIRRIDGLEAVVERWRYLKKYPELDDYLTTNLMYEFLFHYQSAIRCLDFEDKKQAVAYIKKCMKEVGKPKKYLCSFKYRVWFSLFRICPFAIASLRNLLNIGL